MSKKHINAVRYDEVDGKTVAGCGYSEDRMLVLFTDGTCLALKARDSCEGLEIDFAQGRINLLSRGWSDAAFESGAVSEAEYDAARKQIRADEIMLARKQLEFLESTLPKDHS